MKTRYFCFEDGKYWLKEEDVDNIGQDQVLVKTIRSLISVGTETSCNTGLATWKKGSHGYSNAGKVVALGQNVKEFAIGDRLICRKPHTDYFILKPGDAAHRIPDEVSDEDAVFTTLGMVAMHSVECADITLGRTVIVVGQGTVGQLAQQAARLAGAGRVIAVDLDSRKRQLALDLGADAAISPDADQLKQALSGAVPFVRGPVFIELSGSSKAIRWILDVCPMHSDVVILGNYIAECSINPLTLVEREIRIIGSHQPQCPETPVYGYPYSRKFNGEFILNAIKLGRIKVRALSDALLPPSKVIDFYDAVRDGREHPSQPIIKWEE